MKLKRLGMEFERLDTGLEPLEMRMKQVEMALAGLRQSG
jgi:hypothetical protein